MDWERQGVLAWVAESNWKDAAAIKWDGKDRERNRFAKENKNLSVLDKLNELVNLTTKVEDNWMQPAQQ